MRNLLSALQCLLLTALFIASSSFAQSEVTKESLFASALEMFKFDEYIPAADKLEEASDLKQDFNYWLYLGLAFQRTGQTSRAIVAYENALAISPAATNLKSRIRSLKIETQRLDYKPVVLDTPQKKSEYLFRQAKDLRQNKEYDKAFRSFLQALGYSRRLLAEDDGFLTQGEVFYGLKRVDYSELFQGIFQFYQGNFAASDRNISFFLQSHASAPEFLKRRAEDYLKLLNATKAQIANAFQGEEKPATANLVKTPQVKTDKVRVANFDKKRDSDVTALEADIIAESSKRVVMTDSGFAQHFGRELASRYLLEIADETDSEKVIRRIWEIGNIGIHDSEVMQKLTAYLQSEDVSIVLTTLEAISKIGMPSAEISLESVFALLEHEELTVKFVAIENLGKMRANPQKVIPRLAKEYAREKDQYLKRHLYYWVNKFGKPGVKVLYEILEDAARVDRRPVAELISRITGEKVNELINR